MDTETLVIDALTQLGLEAQLGSAETAGSSGLILDPMGTALPLCLKRRALLTEESARLLLAETPSDHLLLVVSDRVTDDARQVLTAGGGGYLDLRGRLAIHADRVLIDASIQPISKRASRSDALAGRAGLEIATALLLEPQRRVVVRELARRLGRSPSTVSDVLAALRRMRLIDEVNTVTGTDLFWQVADRWPNTRMSIIDPPPLRHASVIASLRLGLDDISNPGWALTDSAAAVAYGAPIAVRAEQALDFFVPDKSTLRRAITLLGSAQSPTQARVTVRVAPTPAAVRSRINIASNQTPWPLTHPLFVALDLAQDPGRGHEVLAAWTPDDRWTRVW